MMEGDKNKKKTEGDEVEEELSPTDTFMETELGS